MHAYSAFQFIFKSYLPFTRYFNQEFAQRDNYIKDTILVKLKVRMVLATSGSAPRALQGSSSSQSTNSSENRVFPWSTCYVGSGFNT